MGHSQGTFYTNAAYDYLVKNGVQKDSISVYNVATPADRVADGGNYLTSSKDKVINEVVRRLIEIGSARIPLLANIDILPGPNDQDSVIGGHSLSKTYLIGAPDRIIGDMKKELDGLSPTDFSEKSVGGCFIAPPNDLTHRLQGAGFFVGDGAANFIASSYRNSVSAGQLVYKTIYSGLASLYNFGQGFLSGLAQVFNGSRFFGASLTSTPILIELTQESSNPSEVRPRSDLVEVPVTESLVLNNNQELIDDILERIDLLRRQIADLEAAEKLKQQNLTQNQNQVQEQGQVILASQTMQQNNLSLTTYSGSGGGNNINYPKILISEAQIGGSTDEKEEFVELYNPNNTDVSLAGWYLQRKTKTGSTYSSFAANTLFSGKKISSNGYFLIARQGYFANLADISTDNPLTEDNSLVLKNPNGDVSDKVGWGQAQEYETASSQSPPAGQSVGRKADESDTDNNAVDFELQNPTPKSQNVAYVVSTPSEPSPSPKILINEIQTEGQTTKDEFIEIYNPNNVDVDLKGFALKKKNSSGNESNLVNHNAFSGIVPALGYFLIVPQINDDGSPNYTLSAAPDLYYSGKTFSIADNNTVLLYDKNDVLLDKVGFGTAKDFESAATVNPPKGKSIERKKLGLDTDDNSQDFKISDEPSPKGTFPKTIIQDITNYSSISTKSTLHRLSFKWQSLSQNIDYYQIQYKLNNSQFRDWIHNTKETQGDFEAIYSLFNDNIYQFRARAIDLEENVGQWSEVLEVNMTNPVVINEVAYAGTNSESQDQWIELHNRTNKDINLSGWKIVSGSDGKETLNITLLGTIPANGYFILERNDDKTLLDITANQVFEGVVGKNYLYLRNEKNRTTDEFFTPEQGLNDSSFIVGENHYSSERVSAWSFGFFDKNWKLNNGQILNGLDRDGNQIYGTPGNINSADQIYTYYALNFVEDTVLRKEFSPYLLSGESVQVLKDISLTIEPGVIVKFQDNQSRLVINGTLKAIARSDLAIVFTSFGDDEYGGDSNSDGSATLPLPGDWRDIYFSKESRSSELQNVLVRYGGSTYGFSPLLGGNTVFVDQTSISLKDSLFENNRNRGLVLANSDSVTENVKFLNHTINDWPFEGESKAMYVKGGRPEIKNCYFENNYLGIHLISFNDEPSGQNLPSQAIIENNNFVKNQKPILWGSFAKPTFLNNKATDNKLNAIIFETSVLEDLTLKPDLPYLFNGIFLVPENVTLSLEPGTVMLFLDKFSGLQIDGTLKAIARSDLAITFGYYYEKEDWALPGSWLGLRFTKTSQNSQLEFVKISYGGAYEGHPGNKNYTAAIKVEEALISLKNSLVEKNVNNGLWLVGSQSIVDSVQFLEHNQSTVSLDAKAVYVQGGKPEIKNSFFKNNYYGIYIDDWKDADGKTIIGEPILDKNDFSEGNIKEDIHYVNPPPGHLP